MIISRRTLDVERQFPVGWVVEFDGHLPSDFAVYVRPSAQDDTPGREFARNGEQIVVV